MLQKNRSFRDNPIFTRKGANIEAVDEEGMTPLINAIIKGNLEVVKYLVEKEQT